MRARLAGGATLDGILALAYHFPNRPNTAPNPRPDYQVSTNCKPLAQSVDDILGGAETDVSRIA